MSNEKIYNKLKELDYTIKDSDIKSTFYSMLTTGVTILAISLSMVFTAEALEDKLDVKILNDLTDALQKVIESRKKRLTMLSRDVRQTYIPKSAREISNIIKELLVRVKIFFENNPKQKLFFNHLISNRSKEETVAMFLPLLHLDKEQKLDLRQKKAFGEIEIRMQK